MTPDNEIDFRVILESMPGLFLALNSSFEIMAAGDECLKVMTSDSSQVIGRSIFEIYEQSQCNETFADSLRMSLNRVLETGESHSLQAPFTATFGHDAARKVRRIDNRPVLNADKKVSHIIHRLELEDTHEQNQSSPIDEEKLMRAILDRAYNSFIAIDSDGIITDWNHQAELTFGWTREEIIGKSLAETIIPPEYREAHNRGMAHYKVSGEGPVLNRRIEIQSLRRDGSTFPIELGIFPVHLGSKYSFCAFIADISERKAMLKKLEEQSEELVRSNSELQRFAYVAAHDLREPLRTIVSFTGLLAADKTINFNEEAQENMSFIIEAGKRMQQLITDLLTYSRVESAAKASVLTSSESIFDQTVAEMKVSIEEAGGSITHGPLPEVMADPSQLSQLFLNLVGNALKFRGEKPPVITVSAVRQDADWLFSVKDNGIGIDMKFAERVFQMFQRLHGVAEYPGTGIGLALCKKIVERHGGTITFQSEPGEGTEFLFTLPVIK